MSWNLHPHKNLHMDIDSNFIHDGPTILEAIKMSFIRWMYKWIRVHSDNGKLFSIKKKCKVLVTQSCPTLCNPMDCMDCSSPDSPVLYCLPEFAQTHVHWVGDAIYPSHPLSSPFPFAINLSQHQGLFQWVGSLHLVVKVLELQLQHQS